jgi:general secretion pathway protein J
MRFARATTVGFAAHRTSAGFTLLELLVALAIFAVVAALAWGGLAAVARTQRGLEGAGSALAQLQKTIGHFERDVRQAVPRPIRTESGEIEPALLGSADRLDLSLWRSAASALHATAGVQRASWRCRDGQLLRSQWGAPDRTGATPVGEVVELTQLTGCRFRYVAADGTRSDRWPLPGTSERSLPGGVELSFAIAGSGEFRRLVELTPSAEPRP